MPAWSSPHPCANHLAHTLGVSNDRLLLCWAGGGLRQSARQVVVTAAGQPAAVLWDSGKAAGAEPMLLYGGEALPMRADYQWRVRLWDAADRAGDWSDWAEFEVVPGEADFIGAWVTMPGVLTPMFRSVFQIENLADVVRARWYIACGGLLEPRINGIKAGDQVLFPDHTDYARVTTVAAFDVRKHLRDGENVLGIVLGGGWYAHHGYGPRCFLSQLELTLRGGERRILATRPGDWAVRHGPWTSEDIIHGEWYDARLEAPGWDAPGYALDAAWHALGRSYGKPAPNAAEPPGAPCWHTSRRYLG